MNINSIMELFIFLTVLQTIPVIANFTRPAEGFTADGIKATVDELNKIRSKLALGNFSTNGKIYPSATKMMKVKWDPELAAIAQEYAKTWTGDWGHRPIQYKYFPGLVHMEQYAMTYDPLNDTEYQLWARDAIRHWFTPYIKHGFKNNLMNFDGAQMLMDEISGVGCGILEKTGRVEGGTLRPYVDSNTICFFSPRQFLYKEGKTCSECPLGTKCENATGLCEDIEKEATYNEKEATFNSSSGALSINAIVDTVNKYRSQIALGNVSWNGKFWPSATNMLKIKWDPELAANALVDADYPGLARYQNYWNWRSQMTDSEYYTFGEYDLTDELNTFTGKDFTNVLSAFMTAQLIMADTSGIGCDAILKIISEHDGKKHRYYLRCYLTPRRFIYKEGETCSECPVGTKCENATGLCEEDPSYGVTEANATKKISFGVYFLYFLTFYRIHLL